MPARLAMEEGNRETRALRLANVRRRLFKEDDDSGSTEQQGSGDNEANRLMEEARQNLQQAKEKWNFDFEKEEPLPGRYEWVKADEQFPSDVTTPSPSVPNNTAKSPENTENHSES